MTLDRQVYASRKKVDFYKINDNINNNNNTYNTCLISMTFVAIPPAVAQTPPNDPELAMGNKTWTIVSA